MVFATEDVFKKDWTVNHMIHSQWKIWYSSFPKQESERAWYPRSADMAPDMRPWHRICVRGSREIERLYLPDTVFPFTMLFNVDIGFYWIYLILQKQWATYIGFKLKTVNIFNYLVSCVLGIRLMPWVSQFLCTIPLHQANLIIRITAQLSSDKLWRSRKLQLLLLNNSC